VAESLSRPVAPFAIVLALAIGNWIAVATQMRRIGHVLKVGTMAAVLAAARTLMREGARSPAG
jgi:hypothetical protein